MSKEESAKQCASQTVERLLYELHTYSCQGPMRLTYKGAITRSNSKNRTHMPQQYPASKQSNQQLQAQILSATICCWLIAFRCPVLCWLSRGRRCSRSLLWALAHPVVASTAQANMPKRAVGIAGTTAKNIITADWPWTIPWPVTSVS